MNNVKFTYGRQKALNNFSLNDRLRRDRQQIKLTKKSDQVENDDLLSTNNLDVTFENRNSVGVLPNNQLSVRYSQENYIYLNISSRQREKFTERAVTRDDRDSFPNKELWDTFFDPDSGLIAEDLDLCCQTFNNLLDFGQEFPYFIQRENQLFIQVPKHPNPNMYSILLEPPRKHIRAIRLVSVEAPQFLDPVNQQNNLLLLDVINPCDGTNYDWGENMPFKMIFLPIGTYTVLTLLETMVKELNSAVNEATTNKCCRPFSVIYDERSGRIEIKSELEFHLKFFFSPTNPQFHLWEMLGFEYPFPRDDQNQPIYVKNFSNLIEVPSPLVEDQNNLVPFSRPNLDIYDYVYLSIRYLDVIQDSSIANDIDIFAKVLIKENRFISSTKIFTEPLDKLERIEVNWIDQFGNLLDVKGQENSFTLEIIEYQERLKDSDFSSQRGIHNFDQELTKIQHKSIVSIS